MNEPQMHVVALTGDDLDEYAEKVARGKEKGLLYVAVETWPDRGAKVKVGNGIWSFPPLGEVVQ